MQRACWVAPPSLGTGQVAGDCIKQRSVHVLAQDQAQQELGFASWKGSLRIWLWPLEQGHRGLGLVSYRGSKSTSLPHCWVKRGLETRLAVRRGPKYWAGFPPMFNPYNKLFTVKQTGRNLGMCVACKRRCPLGFVRGTDLWHDPNHTQSLEATGHDRLSLSTAGERQREL